MELDVFTGNRDDAGTFDTNGSGTIDGSDNIRFVGPGASTGSGRNIEGGVPAGTTSVIKPLAPDARPEDCTEIVYVPQSNGTTLPVTQSCKGTTFGRALWREVK